MKVMMLLGSSSEMLSAQSIGGPQTLKRPLFGHLLWDGPGERISTGRRADGLAILATWTVQRHVCWMFLYFLRAVNMDRCR